jgi:uncharacterized protein (TIGR02001 family)
VNPRHVIAFGCGVAWLLTGAPARAHELHGYLSFVTDYVFRGVSQSNEEPTGQAGLDYAHAAGLFAGVFVARTDFPDSPSGANQGQVEVDLYLGYKRAAGRDWTWDIAAVRYEFADSTGSDYSYNELVGNLHYRDILRFGATVSNDADAGGEGGWTAEVELRRPLGDRFQWSGSLGHYEHQRAGWEDYQYWDLGVSAEVGAFTFDVRYFDSSSGAQSYNDPLLTRARVVGSVSVGF